MCNRCDSNRQVIKGNVDRIRRLSKQAKDLRERREKESDREVVLVAVGQDGDVLQYASKELKADRGAPLIPLPAEGLVSTGRSNKTE